MTLRINEIFPTIQGEGSSIGKAVTFLRLSICNLHCKWCDTPYTWNFSKDGEEERWGLPTFKKEDEIKEMEVVEIVTELMRHPARRLVISGGEPMLQQDALTQVMSALLELDGNWFFEIETNGTIKPSIYFLSLINQINCSPKLESSGNSLQLRYNPMALIAINTHSNSWFKFVVCDEKDKAEIAYICNEINIPNEKVYLMPQGRTKEEQESLQTKVQEYAQQCGYNFSPRLHILLWGSKRGV